MLRRSTEKRHRHYAYYGCIKRTSMKNSHISLKVHGSCMMMPEPLTAVLERGRQVLLPNRHSQWVDLLKSGLSRTDRAA
jgi:hypothetical protein